MTAFPRKYLLLLFVLSLTYTLALNFLNVESIRRVNPGGDITQPRALVHGYTVYSVDNYWYVNQVKNYLEHGRFTADIRKDRYEVRRTPVYPLFYGLHYYLFGEAGSYRVIRYTQSLILALAVVALCLAMYQFTGSRRVALITAALYGLYPAIPAAAFHTVTESLSSELVCFSLYFLGRAYRADRRPDWFLGGLFFAMGVLCRPSIFMMGVPALWLLLYQYRKKLREFFLAGIAFAAGALCLFLPWTMRNYQVTGGDIVFLEKFYGGDPMDYGMPNIHLREWISCWNNPANYTSEWVSNLMLINLTRTDPVPRDTLIRQFLDKMPERAFAVSRENDVKSNLEKLYAYYDEKTGDQNTDSLVAKERSASEAFIAMRADYIREAPFSFYVVRNLIFLQSIVFQSNAYSLAFLDNYSGNWFKIVLKGLLYLVSVFSWLSVVLACFLRRFAAFRGYALSGVILSTVFIIGYTHYYEARYTFPVFPLLFGLLAICLNELGAAWRQRGLNKY